MNIYTCMLTLKQNCNR